MNKFQKSLIEQFIKESRVSAEQAFEQGLALAFIDSPKINVTVLYNPTNVYTSLIYDERIDKDDIYAYQMFELKRTVCFEAYTGRALAAKRGYGQLMHDIALSIAGDKGFVPNRTSISADANKMYKRYFERDDLIKEKLVDECCTHGQDHLDVKYIAKDPIDISYFVEAHNRVVERVLNNSNEFTSGELDNEFMTTGNNLFGSLYY